MELGRHSISLAVKDIQTSLDFYRKLGFEPLSDVGSIDEKWLILQNGSAVIGLFQDMFDNNILTFNPTNARANYQALLAKGMTFDTASANIEDDSGPCHFMITDPDGNQILVDQHNP